MQERINAIKSNEEIGVKYMQAWEEKVLERNRGREEGERRIARMNRLYARLLEDDRVEDIESYSR
ncbi:MAG: hypothetical protein Q4C52_01360 [Eubacteriales bacterium]|nr:hypothetical protein [Eubacteriales bacterium]